VTLLLIGPSGSEAFAADLLREAGGGTIFYRAAAGEANDLTVSLDAGTYTFTDPGATITPGLGCDPSPPGSVATCSAVGVTDLEIRLSDLNDTAVVVPATPSVLGGGAGNDSLTGGGGQDRLEGEQDNDTLNGGAGNDELLGEPLLSNSTGQNHLDGGSGDDLLNAGAGPDTALGSSGNDTIFGLAGVDTVDGGDDTDTVSGGDGNDTLRGGAGDDLIGDESLVVFGMPPERGDDTLDGGLGNDVLRPGAGPTQGISDNDLLTGGGGADSVTYEQRVAAVGVSIDGVANDGGAGESDNVVGDVERLVGGQAGDTLVGSAAGDTIDGANGPDVIRGEAGADALDGGVADAESDDVSGGDGDDQVRGNAGDDVLGGDAGVDTVEGGGGADRTSGGADADNVMGGPGPDDVSGGPGDDALDGSAIGPVGVDEADTLRGDAGNDSLEGGDANDTMAGGTGLDTMSGEAGQDTVEYTTARSAVEVTLNDRRDDGERGERDNVRTDVENVSGGGLEDTFTGSRTANTLDGSTGEDFLDGRRGRDELLGGASVDVVRARDGRRDAVDCGRSADFAIVDRRDRIRRCERRDVPGGSPTLGRDVLVEPGAGEPQFGLRQGSRTVPLLDRLEVPMATEFDARKGRVRLRSAGGRGARRSGVFSRGRFTVRQRRSRGAATELRLTGGDFGRCRRRTVRGGAAASQLPRRTIRRLNLRARGKHRAVGNNSVGTTRGTTFAVLDRCDGTLTRVRSGVVVVRDFRLQKTIVVRAGDSYLARARRR
jgi:Ca2+-binding RTX toxin-like protein